MKTALLLLCSCLVAAAQFLDCTPPAGDCDGAQEGACYEYSSCPAPNPNVPCQTNCGTCQGWVSAQESANYQCCKGLALCQEQTSAFGVCVAMNQAYAACWDYYWITLSINMPEATTNLAICINSVYMANWCTEAGVQAGYEAQLTGCTNSQSNTLEYAQAQYDGCMKGCSPQ